MDQEEFEALMERIDEIYEDTRLVRMAIEYLQDHTNDSFLMANLGMICKEASRIENKLDVLLGRPTHHALPALAENVPFD